MTPAQARNLSIGAEVTHILTNEQGTVIKANMATVHIHWDGQPCAIAYPTWKMYSIHVHANPEPSR